MKAFIKQHQEANAQYYKIIDPEISENSPGNSMMPCNFTNTGLYQGYFPKNFLKFKKK